ncbi:MAG TPA: VCBS repeat-containing protein, partial [Longimicrobiaceae bacterium]|nr:VCBS repeat-containing protein [Longimicrobiaceae bacterium]
TGGAPLQPDGAPRRASQGAGGPLFTDATATHLPATPGSSMDTHSVDVDGDGDLDVVIAKEVMPNVLLLNDGTGRFTVSVGRIPPGERDSEDVAVADFDRDGDPDVVVAGEEDQASEFYLNDGRGFFTDASARLPARGTANSVIAADVDGDGDADLLFGNHGQNFLFINGGGHFSDQTRTRLPALADLTQDLEVGDVDGDGDLDLVVGNVGDNRLLLNDGRGFFTEAAPGRLPLRSAVEETREAELVDLDGDGDLDLYFANVAFVAGADPQDRILINDGRGFFTDETARRLGRFTSTTLDAEFVDLDGDGDLDLLTANVNDTKPCRAFLNDGTGTFREATGSVLPPGLTGHMVDIEVADFNGDGRLDLYLSNYVGGADRLLLARD